MAIDGTYKIAAKNFMGTTEGTLVYETKGNVLDGSFTTLGATYPIEDGKVDGNDFEFTVKLKGPIGPTKTDFTGTVDGDKISGKMKAMMTLLPFTGTRTE